MYVVDAAILPGIRVELYAPVGKPRTIPLMTVSRTRFRQWAGWRLVISAVITVLAGMVLVRSHDVLGQSIQVASDANSLLIFTGLLLTALMFGAAAVMYQLLALHKLRFWKTYLIELAAAAINRLLPGGLGSLGVHGVYLYKHRHTVAEATTVVTLNNLLGIAVHSVLLAGVLLVRPDTLSAVHLVLPPGVVYAGALGCGTVAVVCVTVPYVRRRVVRFLGLLRVSLLTYRRRAPYVALACTFALTVSLLYTVILWMTACSLGIEVPFVQCFMVFSLSVLTATATPTPGGVVGAELGLYAGFIAVNLPPESALAITLVFRFITYWVPIAPGLVCFWLARRSGYL